MTPTDLASFFAMGGYGPFIWSAYGLVFVIVAVLALESLASRARARRLLAQLDTAPLDTRGEIR